MAPRALTRASALLGLVALAAGAFLVSSIAWAFYTRLPAGALLWTGATGFFVALGAVALAYLQRTARALGAAPTPRPVPRRVAWLLVALVPINIVAMSFGCGFPGCTPVCVVLTAGAIPMGILAAREATHGDVAPVLFGAMLLYAIPHCVCANAINLPWIERIGVSPACFAFPLLGMAFAGLGLRGVWPRLSVLAAGAPAAVAGAFAVGHHLLGYPW